MTHIININKLSVIRNSQIILNHLNFKCEKSSLHMVVGPNGSGKSTLLKTLCGLIKANNGDISVLNYHPWNDHNKLMMEIGAIIESPTFYDDFTAEEYISFIKKLYNEKVNISLLNSIMMDFKIDKTGRKKIKDFSVGMKMKLAICSCVLHVPKLLILDEPTTGLDPAGVLTLKRWLITMKEKYGTTIVLSSHALADFHDIYDELSFVVDGKVLLTISTKESNDFFVIYFKVTDDQISFLSRKGFRYLYSCDNFSLFFTKENYEFDNLIKLDFPLNKIKIEEIYFLLTNEVI